MLSPRARVGRAPAVRGRQAAPGLVPGLVLALLVSLTGCGSSEEEDKAEGPSNAALSCREKWRDLEAEIDGRNAQANPSGLSTRWNSIAATLDYYATSAQTSDCGKTMAAQEVAMSALATFATKLAPYDIELRLEKVQADAEEYAAGPRPPASKPSPTKNDKKKRVSPPPKPAEIALALKTLTAQAPVATQQQGPGWQQAAVADLGDTAAVAKTVKDLAFLSSESPAYRAGTVALAQINGALNAVKTR